MFALVDYPSKGFQEHAIAVFSFLKRKGVKVHVVSNQKFTPEMLDLIESEDGVVGWSEFNFLSNEVASRADYIYLHNDNSMDRAAYYRAANSSCKMVGYADGWRNAHKNVKELKKIGFDCIHFFGIKNLRTDDALKDMEYEVGLVRDFKNSVSLLAKSCDKVYRGNPKNKKVEVDNLFCVRYWGKDGTGYKFPPGEVAKTWVKTIREYCGESQSVVLKTQKGRFGDQVMSSFCDELKISGIKYSFLSDVFEDNGLDSELSGLPLEYLLYNGCLSVSDTVFSLDSSIPSLILSSLEYSIIPRSFVVGALDCGSSFDGLPGFGTVKSNMKQQERSLILLDECKEYEITGSFDQDCFSFSKKDA